MTSRSEPRPIALTLAAALVALQGLALAVYALLELAHVHAARATMGATTALFFLVYGVALCLCGVGIFRRVSWARSPVVLTQLFQLLLAWSVRDTPAAAIPLGVFSIAVLVCLFLPASVAALTPDE